MKAIDLPANRNWKFPPLILHPFSDASGPERLMESSRASLILQGLLPDSGEPSEELERKLIDGRLYEIRMLFYLGKDLERWVDQCAELAEKDPVLSQGGVNQASFYRMLVDTPPNGMAEKLQNWGVVDSKVIFARAIGLRSIFEDVPSQATVTQEFIENYYRYADQLFSCRMESEMGARLLGHHVSFDLYASGEYARMLEREWAE